MSLCPDEFASLNAKLDEMLAAAGRKPEAVRRSMMTGCVFGKDEAALNEKLTVRGRTAKQLRGHGVVAGSPDKVKAQLVKLEQAGLQRIMLQWLDLDDLDGIETLAKTVLQRQ